MAHFAELDENNIVLRVIVVNNNELLDQNGNESEALGVAFCKSLFGQETEWVQTSYNATFRKNYAGIGHTYDPVLDAFYGPQIFASWTLNTDTAQWEPPVPYPTDGNNYIWDENTLSWTIA